MQNMEKAANIQMQIRQNNNELTDFLQDLNRWEEKIKHDDEELRISRRIDEKVHIYYFINKIGFPSFLLGGGTNLSHFLGKEI